MMKSTKTFQKLRDRERQRRKDIILDAAERVFATTPFTEVNMRRIAREAGISPASIYTYFTDQEALFVDTYLRRSRDMADRFKAVIQDSNEDAIEKTAFTYIDYFIGQDVYFRMMAHFMLYARLSPDSLEKLNSMERVLLDTFEDAFKKSGASGNTRYLAHLFFAALNGILITFHRYPGRKEEEVYMHMRRLASIFCGLFD